MSATLATRTSRPGVVTVPGELGNDGWLDISGDNLEPQSSGWYVKRLLAQMDANLPDMTQARDYYRGKQRLQFASQKFRQVFGDLFAEFADNFASLVVDSVAERLVVQGFQMGGDEDSQSDSDAWRIWQANQLDAQSQIAHVDALVKGVCYVHVSPYEADQPYPGVPSIRIEDAMGCVVEYDEENPQRRAAALKRWRDDSGYVFLNLYLPDRIEKYRSEAKVQAGSAGTTSSKQRWQPRETPGEAWPLENPLGVVPIIALNNRLEVDGSTRSEIHEVIPIQDAINKLVMDMMLASEFAAFPQKWVTNFVLEVDPDTGEPVEPYKIAVDKLLTAPPPEDNGPEVKFGQFDAADLSQYGKAISDMVQHLASISRTPPHYFLAGMGNFPSGESLRAAEAGLVTKARWRMLQFGETWEEVIRLAFKAINDPRGDVIDSETIWKDPETRTEAEHVDALLKLSALKVPLQQLWKDAGYSPQEIARFIEQLREEALIGIGPAVTSKPISESGPAGVTVPGGSDPATQAGPQDGPPTVPADPAGAPPQ